MFIYMSILKKTSFLKICQMKKYRGLKKSWYFDLHVLVICYMNTKFNWMILLNDLRMIYILIINFCQIWYGTNSYLTHLLTFRFPNRSRLGSSGKMQKIPVYYVIYSTHCLSLLIVKLRKIMYYCGSFTVWHLYCT